MAVQPNIHFPPSRVEPATKPESPRERARRFLRRHGRKLWWLHSIYALGLGLFVVAFAQKGFEHARWLAVTLGVTWMLVVLFFRLVDRRPRQSTPGLAPAPQKLRFYVMTYVLKNLYQGMLFFLLPFYWKSATPGAPNFWFVLVLGACALVSTVDLLFDHLLMRARVLASVFHAITLFACMNLVIPALFPNTRTLWTLLSAAGLTVIGFWTIHLRRGFLQNRRYLAFLVISVAAGVGIAYGARVAIPPVPMHLSSVAAVGPSLLPDGRLAMEATTVRAAALADLIAVTDVVVPGGEGDQLVHVWRHGGVAQYRAPEATSRVQGSFGTVRLRSKLAEPVANGAVGNWSVDVETDDGQLVGRVPFTVVE